MDIGLEKLIGAVEKGREEERMIIQQTLFDLFRKEGQREEKDRAAIKESSDTSLFNKQNT